MVMSTFPDSFARRKTQICFHGAVYPSKGDRQIRKYYFKY